MHRLLRGGAPYADRSRFGFHYVCKAEKLYCLDNSLSLGMSIVNTLVLMVVTCKLFWRLIRHHNTTTMGRRWLPRGHEQGLKNYNDLIDWMVLVLCFINMSYYIPDILFTLDGNAMPISWLVEHGLKLENRTTLFYALARQCMTVMNILWHVHIGHAAYCWVVLKHSITRIHRSKTRSFYVVVAVGIALEAFSMIFCVLATTEVTLLFLVWSTFVLGLTVVPFCGVLLLRLYIKTVRHLRVMSGAAGGRTTENGARLKRVAKRLLRVSLAVVVVWIIGNILDMTVWALWAMHHRKQPVALFSMRVILLRISGIFDTFVLGGLCDGCLLQRLVSTENEDRVVSSAPQWSCRQMQSIANAGSRPVSTVKIFATTWNMGGRPDGGLKDLVPLWIPPGYDMYVVSLQECMCLKEIRAAIHNHLNTHSDSQGALYTMYKREIGDSVLLHGMIALTVFVRTEDVESGAVVVHDGAATSVNTGVSLGLLGTAPNKGSTGISVRYFDTTIALIATHFAADRAGSSRASKRDLDSRAALRKLSLQWDEHEFDTHLQHHHAILLGDLNYRVRAPPHEVLEMVAMSARKEKARMACDQWRKLSYSALFDCGNDSDGVGNCHGSDDGQNNNNPQNHNYHHNHVRDTYSTRDRSSLRTRAMGGTDERREKSSRYKTWARFNNRETSTAGGEEGHSCRESATGAGQRRSRLMTTTGRSSFLGGGDGNCGGTLGTGGLMGVGFGARNLNSSSLSDETGSPWKWVDKFDELLPSLRSDRVLCGFTEGPIRFPPSYRWRRDAGTDVVGDFVDPTALDKAYCVRLGDNDGYSRMRTPSYTDRILTYSAPDKFPHFRWRHYDLCEAVTGSDHKPVAAALLLDVDRRVRGFSCIDLQKEEEAKKAVPPVGSRGKAPTSSSHGSSNSRDKVPAPLSYATLVGQNSGSSLSPLPSPFEKRKSSYENSGSTRRLTQESSYTSASPERLTATRSTLSLTPSKEKARERDRDGEPLDEKDFEDAMPCVVTMELADMFFDVDGIQKPEDIGEIVLLYPPMGEDPLAGLRKAWTVYSFFQDLPASYPRGLQDPLRRCAWSPRAIRFVFVASRRFSEHALIKFVDREGGDLGQGILLVNRMLPPPSPGDPPFLPDPEPLVKERCVYLGLTSGGVSTGYVTLSMRVTIKYLSARSSSCLYELPASICGMEGLSPSRLHLQQQLQQQQQQQQQIKHAKVGIELDELALAEEGPEMRAGAHTHRREKTLLREGAEDDDDGEDIDDVRRAARETRTHAHVEKHTHHAREKGGVEGGRKDGREEVEGLLCMGVSPRTAALIAKERISNNSALLGTVMPSPKAIVESLSPIHTPDEPV